MTLANRRLEGQRSGAEAEPSDTDPLADDSTLALFPVIVWVYARLALKEERQMVEQFGDEYQAYQRRMPMFFPRTRRVAAPLRRIAFVYRGEAAKELTDV